MCYVVYCYTSISYFRAVHTMYGKSDILIRVSSELPPCFICFELFHKATVPTFLASFLSASPPALVGEQAHRWSTYIICMFLTAQGSDRWSISWSLWCGFWGSYLRGGTYSIRTIWLSERQWWQLKVCVVTVGDYWRCVLLQWWPLEVCVVTVVTTWSVCHYSGDHWRCIITVVNIGDVLLQWWRLGGVCHYSGDHWRCVITVGDHWRCVVTVVTTGGVYHYSGDHWRCVVTVMTTGSMHFCLSGAVMHTIQYFDAQLNTLDEITFLKFQH